MTETIKTNIITNQTDTTFQCEVLIKKRGRPKKTVEVTSEKEPKKKGRPIVPWRHGEDGKYHSHSADPTYSTRYWQEHYRKPFECKICGKVLQCCGSGVHKHQRGMHCQLAKLKKQLEPEN